MASPQVEEGYIRIANELLDAMLATEFTGRELRILFAIMRYSYGWNKKEAYLTQRHFQQVTGLSKSTISDVLRRLIRKNVITLHEPDTYSVQKDYERWQIDQRRYKPLTNKEPNESEEDFTESKKDLSESKKDLSESDNNFVRKQIQKGGLTMPEKSNNDKDLNNMAQFLHKDIYKDISLIERLYEKLKKEFSNIDEQALRAICTRYPERVDYFLYLIESYILDPQSVKNPIAYITSLRPTDFPSLPERAAQKKAQQQQAQQELDRLKAVREQIYNTDHATIKGLVSSFVKTLKEGGNNGSAPTDSSVIQS
ncbi:MAG: replication protein [Thermodesulfovibrionales bacterium]